MIDREAIIRHLDGKLHSGMCRCPCHEDDKESLHVSEKNGKVLVHCHAGCSQESLLAYFKAHGLWGNSTRRADFQTRRRRPHHEQQDDEAQRPNIRLQRANWILRSAHQYQKEDGAAVPSRALAPYFKGRGIETVPPWAMYMPLAEMSRFADQHPEWGVKPFPAMLLVVTNDQGHFRGTQITYLSRDGTKNLKGSDGKSFRRSWGLIKKGFVQLSKWPDPDRPLLASEGVENALSVAALTDYAAIACTSAANMAEVIPPPSSRLIILADNDRSGTGMNAAKKLAARINRAGGEAVIVPPPGDHNDWNDAVRAANGDGQILKDYRELIEDAEPFAGDSKVYAPTNKEVLDMEIPPQDYLMRPWLTTGSLAQLHAQRGAGKTNFAMSACYAIATGNDFMSWPVERSAKVLYVDGELPAALLQARLQVLGTSPNFRVLSRDLLMREDRLLPDLATPEGRAFLDAVIEDHGSELIVLDSLSTLIHSGEENAAETWAPVQAWLLGHRFRGRTILFLHHDGKNKTSRGTTKREDVIDVSIGLRPHEGEVDEMHSAFELRFDKNRNFYGADAAPLLLRLSTETGTAQWTSERLRDTSDETREQVAELRAQGKSQKQIAEAVGLSQSQVSRLLRAADE